MLPSLDGAPNSEPPVGDSTNGGAPLAAREARALPKTNCMDTAKSDAGWGYLLGVFEGPGDSKVQFEKLQLNSALREPMFHGTW